MATARISPLCITLDTSNPRFLNAQIDEAGAISYLIKYSKVIDLAKSIVLYGGLYMGERIVVLDNQNGTYTVLEGNRRTCACKLLLYNELIPASVQAIFPVPTRETLNSLQEIEVDVVTNRDDAAKFIASRHVGSVELWSPIAKMKFFADRFNSGETLREIASATNSLVKDVRQGIISYNLLFYGIDLTCWTPEQRQSKLNLFEIEINRYLRVFGTRGAMSALKLSYDARLRPVSALNIDVFNRAVQRIMFCALITENPNEKINTRTNWQDVPGLMDILGITEPINNGNNATTNTGNTAPNNPTSGDGTINLPNIPPTTSPIATATPVAPTTSPPPTATPTRLATPTHARDRLIPSACHLNITNPKIRNIYAELQRLNIDSFTNV